MMGESKSCMTSSFLSNLKSNFWTHAVLRSIPSNILEGKGIWSFLVCEDVLYARFCTRKCSPEEESVGGAGGEEGGGYYRERNVGGDWEKNTGMSRRIYREVLMGILL